MNAEIRRLRLQHLPIGSVARNNKMRAREALKDYFESRKNNIETLVRSETTKTEEPRRIKRQKRRRDRWPFDAVVDDR
jgi:hypothetical protein